MESGGDEESISKHNKFEVRRSIILQNALHLIAILGINDQRPRFASSQVCLHIAR